MTGFVLTLAVSGSCASDLPAVPNMEMSSGNDESSSTEVTSMGTLDPNADETGDTLAPTGTETSDTGTEPGCGNGIVEVGEHCDDTDLFGGTCEGLGFGVGMLGCDDACRYETSGCAPPMPVLSLSFSQVKLFDFTWTAVQGADYYQLLESPGSGEPYVQVGGDIMSESASFEMPLHFRWQASYRVRACNAAECTDSAAVEVMGSLADAVGYIKASNTGEGDFFGYSVALSGDGNTLAVGAYEEDSDATGIGGNQANNGTGESGAVYVFVRDGAGDWSQQEYIKASNADLDLYFGSSVVLSGDGNTLAVSAPGDDSDGFGSGAVYVFVRDGAETWSQQAYIKASNAAADDGFGGSMALAGDGDTLAVGSRFEDSGATGIGGNQADNSVSQSGAVYVFVRNGAGAWSQQAYVKASNTGVFDAFGGSVALSGDGDTLAVGADGEDSNSPGIGGNQANNSAGNSGAVYVFIRDGAGAWSQQAYVKASSPGSQDFFGSSLALSGGGNTLAVSAPGENSNATGIGGNQLDESANDSGAVYVFLRNGAGAWSQQVYIKASNTGADDAFGTRVAVSEDGNTLAVSAPGEDSFATGVGGNQANNILIDTGAVYVFVRDGADAWSQQAYVKASNTGVGDMLGISVALSGDGNTLAIGAEEDSIDAGIGGNQVNNNAIDSGAVYLY